MRILLLGSNGQVGWELRHTLPDLGEVKSCGRSDVDLTNFDAIRTVIADFKPDCIINAAAYTAVDRAESEAELAFRVNAEAVAVLAEEAQKLDSWLIHYSTDYVFDGCKTGPYKETDETNPINVYGLSKLAGEQAIINSGCKHLIFRTSWVMGRHGKNFVRTILRLVQERDSLSVVDDQHGAPTTAGLIAKVTQEAVVRITAEEAWLQGIYHLAPHGQTTWYGLAELLVELAGRSGMPITINKSKIHPIATADYHTPARRPLNSRLDTQKLEGVLSFQLPSWKDDFIGVSQEIIKELK